MKRLVIMSLLSISVSGICEAQMDPEAEQARQLITRIRKRMKTIDEALLTSHDPKKAAESLEANIKDLDDLLKSVEGKQGDVIGDIDELVRLAKYQEQKNKQQQQPNQNQQQNQKNQQDQQNPQRPKSQDPNELAQQDPQKKDQKQNKPEDSTMNEQQPQQENADSAPPKGETGQHFRVDVSERWGHLPAKQGEDLINAGANRLPERYRRYLEAYYRRVNDRRR